MPKQQVIQHDGRYWFSAPYAAKLLGTSARKIEMIWLRELCEGLEDKGSLFVAESFVTEYRNAKPALRKLLHGIRIARAPARPDIGSTVPRLGTKARDDQHGLPLADERRFPISRAIRYTE